jgi:hypothetical protein
VQEHASGAGQVLGDDGVQEPRGDTSLNDEAAEPARGCPRLVVVERVAVAGELGEELDVAGLHDPRALRVPPDLDVHGLIV